MRDGVRESESQSQKQGRGQTESKEQGSSEISGDRRQGHKDTGRASKGQRPETQRDRDAELETQIQEQREAGVEIDEGDRVLERSESQRGRRELENRRWDTDTGKRGLGGERGGVGRSQARDTQRNQRRWTRLVLCSQSPL